MGSLGCCISCKGDLQGNEAVCPTCVEKYGQNAVGTQVLVNKIIARGYGIWMTANKIKLLDGARVVGEQDWPGDFVSMERYAK